MSAATGAFGDGAGAGSQARPPVPPVPPGSPPPPAGAPDAAGDVPSRRHRRHAAPSPAGSTGAPAGDGSPSSSSPPPSSSPSSSLSAGDASLGGSARRQDGPYGAYGQRDPSGYAREEAGPGYYRPPQAYPAPGQGQAQAQGQAQGQAVRRPRTDASTVPRTRKARLRVAKADPWSVMKVSFLLSIAMGICLVIAVAVLWMVMDAMGVFSTVGDTISAATETDSGSGFDLEAYLSLSRVLLFTAVIAVIDVVLATALATLGAFMYNISAGFVGGIEVTLAEDE